MYTNVYIVYVCYMQYIYINTCNFTTWLLDLFRSKANL